jgi:hypothetical protein
MFTTRPEIRGTFGVVASTRWLASSACNADRGALLQIGFVHPLLFADCAGVPFAMKDSDNCQ